MALAFTVTLLADHKGQTRPRVSGDEYFVDALVDVTSVVAAGSVIPAADFGLSTISAAFITGGYESSSSIALMFTSLDGTNATVANDGDGGSVRMRVYGNL